MSITLKFIAKSFAPIHKYVLRGGEEAVLLHVENYETHPVGIKTTVPPEFGAIVSIDNEDIVKEVREKKDNHPGVKDIRVHINSNRASRGLKEVHVRVHAQGQAQDVCVYFVLPQVEGAKVRDPSPPLSSGASNSKKRQPRGKRTGKNK